MNTTYAHPEVLVSTEWVDEHKEDPNLRLVEVNVDTPFTKGHIPGAVGWSWKSQLSDPIRRDVFPGRTSRRRCAPPASRATGRSSSTATRTTGLPPEPSGR